LAQGSGEHVFGAMQPESTRPKRSLLAKTLCLLALLGAVYVLATGMPTMVTGAFSAVSFMRPVQAGRAVGVRMADGIDPYFAGKLAKDPERAANLAKAEEMRLAFMQRNPGYENGERYGEAAITAGRANDLIAAETGSPAGEGRSKVQNGRKAFFPFQHPVFEKGGQGPSGPSGVSNN